MFNCTRLIFAFSFVQRRPTERLIDTYNPREDDAESSPESTEGSDAGAGFINDEAMCVDGSADSSSSAMTLASSSGNSTGTDVSSSSSDEDDDDDQEQRDADDAEPSDSEDDSSDGGGPGAPPGSESSDRESINEEGNDRMDEDGNDGASDAESDGSDIMMVYVRHDAPPAAARPRDFPPEPTAIVRALVGVCIESSYDIAVGDERSYIGGMGLVSISYYFESV